MGVLLGGVVGLSHRLSLAAVSHVFTNVVFMARQKNKDQQWRQIIQGLALGCLTLGEVDLPSSKIETEFAFAYAWRRWSFAGEFPSIRDRDFFIYMRKSPRRESSYAAFDAQSRLTPYVKTPDWEVGQSLDAFVEDSDIPATEWVELARLFVERLPRYDT
ncbi:hypothetical protein FB385_3146 [Paramicrobacterium agarici]|nr:hypothetical protein FB385_3146 [Microbacterium agarici]